MTEKPTSRKISRLALAALFVALAFPTALLLTARRDYAVNPWDELSNAFRILVLLLPLAAIVIGHLAAIPISRNRGRTKGTAVRRLALTIGYSSLVICYLFVLTQPRGPHFEASAVASLKTIHATAALYAQAHPKQGFPAKLSDFSSDSQPSCDWCLDECLKSGVKGRYRFTYIARSTHSNSLLDAYEVYAVPVRPQSPYTHWYFFTNETGVIHLENNVPATSRSPAIE